MNPLQMPPLGLLPAPDGSILLVAALDCVVVNGARVYDCQPVWAEQLSSN